MKKTFSLLSFAALALLVACGDTVESTTVNQMGMDVVASAGELPNCSKDNEGELAFVKDENATRVCVDGKWVASSSDGSNGAAFSCKTETLKDSSGLKIVCNGDSIGVVLNGAQGEAGKNGENGKDGADGEDGKAGSGCTISGKTDSTVTVKCGDSTMVLEIGNETGLNVMEPDSERTPISLDSLVGFTQKGPFLKGSTVYLYELSDGRTLKQTNGNFTSNIARDDGRYKFNARDLVSQYAMVVVDGYYRNEVTGVASNTPIRLKAITDMRKRSSVNVNILTHLEFERVYYLVTRGDSTGKKLTVKKAKQQAQREILNEFHIELGENTDAEDMNVFGTSDADAALLAISILLQGDRLETELMANLSDMQNDMAEDGKWNGAGADSVKAAMAIWALNKRGRMKDYRNNVKSWGLGAVPSFEKFIDGFILKTLGFDNCDNSNEGKKFVVSNRYSPFDGKTYVCKDGNYVEVRAEKTHFNPYVQYGEMIDLRDHKVYKTVDIGPQTWMAENLDYADSLAYPVLKKRSWCYDLDPENCEKYGRLYSWSVAMDSLAVFSDNGKDCGNGPTCSPTYPVRGICPEGWHIPLVDEWRLLYGIDSLARTWVVKGDDEYPNATDRYGFSILRSGIFQTTQFWNGAVFFWGANDAGPWGSGSGYVYGFFINGSKISNDYSVDKKNGSPIRCLKDKEIVYGQLTDSRDGQVYRTVKISGKTWMADNLNYRYSLETETADSSSRCFLDRADTCAKMGRLYRWSAVMDSAALFSDGSKGCGNGSSCSIEGKVRGICPEGWHLPTKTDLEELLKLHGWSTTALIERDPEARDNWKYGTNVLGFSIKNSNSFVNNMWYHGNGCLFSATEAGEDKAYRTCIRPDSYYFPPSVDAALKNDLYSVRCIKGYE